MSTHVDYDRIASTYHARYSANDLQGIGSLLASFARKSEAGKVLEVGCGTGRWMSELSPIVGQVYGVDRSQGMLRQARGRAERASLACGDAVRLPLADAEFDLVYCVQALHHFSDPRTFLTEARRVLRPDGALIIIGMDPHTGKDDWYLYRYFEGTFELDQSRFPSPGSILDWAIESGFGRAEFQVAERIFHQFTGPEVLSDPFLKKHSTSQLVLLSDEAYAVGLDKIRGALREASDQGKPLSFKVDIRLMAIAFFPSR